MQKHFECEGSMRVLTQECAQASATQLHRSKHSSVQRECIFFEKIKID